ncbi:YsnF/AvaK domain-containing protein [Microvirga sp. P5_D2]
MTNKTITAFFDSYEDASEAVRRLEAAGIPHRDVSLIANNEGDRYSSHASRTFDGTNHHDDDVSDGAGTGATVGTLAGGGAGLLAGLGMLAIPGLGPVVAAGWLVSTLVGAGAGAAIGGLTGALVDAGVDENDAHSYAEGIRRGGALVTVRASDTDVDRIVDILDDEGTVDFDERENTWRSEGWTGAGVTNATAAAGLTDRAASKSDRAEEVIPIAEEELHVGKREVNRGRVRLNSRIVERPVQEQVSLREERVQVERRPVSGTTQAGAISGDPFQERTIEVEERAEEAVVSKEARVVEEVVVRKQADQRTETVSDTVRRTEVDVEDERSDQTSRTGTTGNPSDRNR